MFGLKLVSSVAFVIDDEKQKKYVPIAERQNIFLSLNLLFVIYIQYTYIFVASGVVSCLFLTCSSRNKVLVC